MDRFTEAYNRVSKIMDILNSAGFDINNPWSIEDISLPENIKFASGATRLVVWDEDNPDYVAKMALELDDERYCIHEVELYNAAVKAGLEAHFGWCAEIYCYGSRSVYAMEYLKCDDSDIESKSYKWGYERYCAEEKIDTESEESKEAYYDYYWGGFSGDGGVVLQWIEAHMVAPVVEKFEEFVSKYDISDIHSQNVGYRNGQLVLCDYAGFGW